MRFVGCGMQILEVTHLVTHASRHVIRDHCVTKGVTSRTKLVLNQWVGSTCHPLPSPQERVGVQAAPPPPRPASTPLAPACWVDAPARCIGASDLACWSTPAHAGPAPPPLRAGLISLASAHWVSIPRSARCMDAPTASAPVLVLVPSR